MSPLRGDDRRSLTVREARTPAGSSPVGKGMQIVPIFPRELEEFRRAPIGGFFAQESFKTPLDIGTAPRPETVAARSEPVEFEEVPHESVVSHQQSVLS
jgi:hypothetical protein